jgi:hypothetical protein
VLRLEVRLLDLGEGVLLAEDLDEQVEVGLRVGGPDLLERLADAQESPIRTWAWVWSKLPVDARLVVVVALEEAREASLIRLP